MISGRDFAERLQHHGFDFFTGVPCSLIEDLIAVLERGGGRAPYVAAAIHFFATCPAYITGQVLKVDGAQH